MSLRGSPIEHDLTLPDGRQARLTVGLAQDDYIPAREQQTVVLELRIGRFAEAVLNTVLDPSQDDAAAELAQEVVAGLESGHIQPGTSPSTQTQDQNKWTQLQKVGRMPVR